MWSPAMPAQTLLIGRSETRSASWIACWIERTVFSRLTTTPRLQAVRRRGPHADDPERVRPLVGLGDNGRDLGRADVEPGVDLRLLLPLPYRPFLSLAARLHDRGALRRAPHDDLSPIARVQRDHAALTLANVAQRRGHGAHRGETDPLGIDENRDLIPGVRSTAARDVGRDLRDLGDEPTSGDSRSRTTRSTSWSLGSASRVPGFEPATRRPVTTGRSGTSPRRSGVEHASPPGRSRAASRRSASADGSPLLDPHVDGAHVPRDVRPSIRVFSRSAASIEAGSTRSRLSPSRTGTRARISSGDEIEEPGDLDRLHAEGGQTPRGPRRGERGQRRDDRRERPETTSRRSVSAARDEARRLLPGGKAR